MKITSAQARQIKRDYASRSLAEFTKQAWPIVEPSTPLVWNFHLDVVCAYLEAVNDPEKSAIIIIMQRLHTDDLTGHLLKKAKSKWVHLKIPMRYEGSQSFDAGRDIGRPDMVLACYPV